MTTRSVLVHLPGFPLDTGHLMPQRDLACMASALLESGHWTRVLDYGTLSATEVLSASNDEIDGVERRRAELVADINALAPLDFAVFQVRTRADYGEALQAGRRLRELPHAPKLFLRGDFAAGYGGMLLLADDAFDGVLRGDAADSLPALAAWLLHPGADVPVPFLIYRAGQRLQAAQPRLLKRGSAVTPCYDPDVYPAVSEEEKFLFFSVGPGSCAGSIGRDGVHNVWQPWHTSAGAAVRAREEMQSIAKVWGGAAFHLSGVALTLAGQERVARELLEHGCRYPFSAIGHLGADAPQVLPLLRRAGCEALQFDVRTGSQILQDDFYGSGHRMSCAEESLSACHDNGMLAHVALTYPCPWDDHHTVEETLRFLRRCRPETATLTMPELREGSVWWQQPSTYGFRVNQRSILRWLGAAACSQAEGPIVDEVPYRMRGWPARRIMTARRHIVSGMRRLGVARCGMAHTAMIARISGYRGDEGAYGAILSGLLSRGETSALRGLVREFNASVMGMVRDQACVPFRPALEAVGN